MRDSVQCTDDNCQVGAATSGFRLSLVCFYNCSSLCGDDVRDYDDQSAAGLVIAGWDTVYTAELINASQQTYQAVLGQACAVSNCV